MYQRIKMPKMNYEAFSSAIIMSNSANQKLVLGLDIGTTSVKVCLVEALEGGAVVARQAKDTQAAVPSELGCEGNKQNVPKIMSALHICVSRLPRELLRQVVSIGVSGQMHGVMLWRYEEGKDGVRPWERVDCDSSRYDVVPSCVSSLYTWQDSRCDPPFLSLLPRPDSYLRAYSGYGCNTLFWLAKNRPEKLKRFNCAGTIQDFCVTMLCNLAHPAMSVQNAASWGYFDPVASQWNLQLLEEAFFPVDLLPTVADSGTLAGCLAEPWHCIPAGTPIGVAMGDLQCSVLSTLRNPDDAVLNISTSAQLAFIAKNFDTKMADDNWPVEYFPYFGGQTLAVAASLNGGNALATFISMLQQWTLDLGFHLPQGNLWSRVMELASDESAESDLCVVPTLLGERHAPQQNASISNMDPGNLSLGKVFKAVCRGIITNLHSVMPREMLLDANISRILGIGSALTRNKILQEEVRRSYQLPVVFIPGGDAAWGAALAVASLAPTS